MSKELIVPNYDLTDSKSVPDLFDLEVSTIDLVSEYWTPEAEGETKRVFFEDIGNSFVPDREGNQIELRCAFFIEQTEDGDTRRIRNGSKRLVGAIENNNIVPGTPLQIVYKGKVKNQTNPNFSDTWQVNPLFAKE